MGCYSVFHGLAEKIPDETDPDNAGVGIKNLTFINCLFKSGSGQGVNVFYFVSK